MVLAIEVSCHPRVRRTGTWVGKSAVRHCRTIGGRRFPDMDTFD
jgi:hypothetical protein